MLLASCGTDIKFHKWPSGDHHGSFQISETETPIHGISWCCEGELLVATSPSLISPIIISVGQTIPNYQVVDLTNVQTAAFSRTKQNIVAFGCKNGQMLLYDVKKQETIEDLPNLPSEIKLINFGAQDSNIAVACTDGQICVYNSNNNLCSSFYVPNSNKSLTTMSYHPTEPHLLGAGSEDGIVVVWDSTTGKTNFVNQANKNCITDIAFSSGTDLAIVNLDKKLLWYDLRTNECVYSLNANNPLIAVEFVPNDDDQIAVASIDGMLFSYDKRKMLHAIAQNLNTIRKLAFRPKSFKKVSQNSIPSSTKMIYKTQFRSNVESRSTINSIVPASLAGYLNYRTPASGDYNIINDGLQISTTSSNYMYLHSNKSSLTSNICNTAGTTNILNKLTMPHENHQPQEAPSQRFSISVTSTERDKEIEDFKRELQEFTLATIEQLSELINREFLNLRMAISKRFATIESKLNTKWKEFHVTLAELAGHDLETSNDVETRSNQEF